MTSSTQVTGGMTWTALANGNVQLRIADEERMFAEIEVPARMMSIVVADALLATGAASNQGARGGGQDEAELDELPAVPIGKIALAPSTLDDHKTLVLEVGHAQLGFTVPDHALGRLAQLLLQVDQGAGPSG